MIKRASELKTELIENMHGGEGTIEITQFAGTQELNFRGKFYSRVTIHPGCSIGFHTHTEDSEVIYVAEGTLDYDDNGNKTTAGAGDVLVCPSGKGHSMTNSGSSDIVLMAAVIYAN